MSTRATYQFKRQYGRDVTVYIHHDGYPAGAAGLYLVPAIELAAGYLTPEWFIRANERAEITDSHQAHGDTEYRYTIDLAAGTVKVEHRNLLLEPVMFRPEWTGTLADFVNKHGQEFRPGVKVRRQGQGRWMTAEMAKADAVAKAEAAASYRERFPQYTGNADSMDADARRAAEFAAEFDAQQVAA